MSTLHDPKRFRVWGRVCVGALHQPQFVDLHRRILAADAGEDWAALSGRPRKANAGQYTSVMHQRDFTQRRPRLPPRGAVALLGAAGLIGARRRKA